MDMIELSCKKSLEVEMFLNFFLQFDFRYSSFSGQPFHNSGRKRFRDNLLFYKDSRVSSLAGKRGEISEGMRCGRAFLRSISDFKSLQLESYSILFTSAINAI